MSKNKKINNFNAICNDIWKDQIVSFPQFNWISYVANDMQRLRCLWRQLEEYSLNLMQIQVLCKNIRSTSKFLSSTDTY